MAAGYRMGACGLMAGLFSILSSWAWGVTFHVSPSGDDAKGGDGQHPFKTLERAQQAVRQANSEQDVTVSLANGVYRLTRTLVFAAADGGQKGHGVSWIAEPGAKPVISGAVAVEGFRLFDKARQIYVTDVPAGVDARQLWVNDRLAPRAAIEIPRGEVRFTPDGLVIGASVTLPKDFDKLPEQTRIEVEGTGFFTDRFSPVKSIHGRLLEMQQPAWKNNTWGWDTLNHPFGPETAHLWLVNSLSFLSQPGQWYLDAGHGKLYVRPPANSSIDHLKVELPRLTTLVAVGDRLEKPTVNLTFKGLRFFHTTWLGPAANTGYASQQSGAYLVTTLPDYPADALESCKEGCPQFEHVRNEWNQMPAAVQVAAANHITFEQNVFAHLGQYALGIGNDANANHTGVGLGTVGIFVRRNLFTDLAGGAILAGGVRRDAHHPHDPRQLNAQLFVINNRIHDVSKDYRDNSAILATYVDGATILHNDISDTPYDAIDVGYGWGIQDAGGNPNYRLWFHGYDYPENLVYDTPTTHRDVFVGYNRIHRAKLHFRDGGAIYNLSASPGTIIAENYIYDNNGRIALYLDEGSRYITVRDNVVADPQGTWLNANTVHNALPLRVTLDNTATGNWHDGVKVGGLWDAYHNNQIVNDHSVANGQWPEGARKVMENAGIEQPVAETPENP